MPQHPGNLHLVLQDTKERHGSTSAWSPLRQLPFRALWIATVVSNIGTWMQNVGAAWLMTALTPSPVMVALVQAAKFAGVSGRTAGRRARRRGGPPSAAAVDARV